MNATIQEQIKINPHPLKAVFIQAKVPIAAIAQYLDVSYAYCAGILRGHFRVTDEIEKKLQSLAKEIGA